MGYDTKDNVRSTKEFNWQNILQRINETNRKLEQGWAPLPEKQKLIFEKRARALALNTVTVKPAESQIDVVEFILAYETYAMESSFIREVFPLKEFTPLPGTPFFVLGVTNVRGEIVSVIDIKKFFDLPDKGLTDLNKLIIVRDDNVEFGILADSIIGTSKISVSDIQPSLPTLTDVRANYLKGITKERVVILDGFKLLDDRKISAT
ncbi:MAG: chemotaxis protein CheW [Bacteroidota bacterium]